MQGIRGLALVGIATYVIISLALNPVMSSIQTSLTVSNHGSIDARVKIVYATGFENATKNPRGWYLNLVDVPPDYPQGPPCYNYISSIHGYDQWIEGLESRPPAPIVFPANFYMRPNSNRCLGLYRGPDTARSNFALWTVPSVNTDIQDPENPLPQPNLTGNEFYISEWLFLPSFSLVSTSDQWRSLFQVSNAGGDAFPYHQFAILGNTGHSNVCDPGTYTAALTWRTASYFGYLQIYRNFQNVLPIGRWFSFEWYMLRNATNGVIKCWVDGVKIFDISGIDTTCPGTAKYPGAYSIDTQLYSGESTELWQFLDDVTIWKTLPPP